MSQPPPNPLPRFLRDILLFMPLTLVIWWFGARFFLIILLEPGLRLSTEWLMADKLVELTATGEAWVFKTAFSPINKPMELAWFLIPSTRFTLVFPLFWGLALATPSIRTLRQLILGTLILFAVSLLMVLMYTQFKLGLLINHQAAFTHIPRDPYLLVLPYPDYLYYLMGVGRQLSFLILPTLAPLLLWGLLNQGFIRRLIVSGIMRRDKPPTPLAKHD